jgi:hypothetical protein
VKKVFLLSWVMLATGGVALAHHSLGMFDMQKSATIDGTVSKFEWTNPHAWVWVTVNGANGKQEEWGMEMAALSMLRRNGYSKDSFKAGEKVKIELHPVKDGRIGGAFIRATFADGRTLGRAPGAGPPGGPPGAVGTRNVAGDGSPTENK